MALVPIPARVTSSRMSLPTPSMHPVRVVSLDRVELSPPAARSPRRKPIQAKLIPAKPFTPTTSRSGWTPPPAPSPLFVIHMVLDTASSTLETTIVGRLSIAVSEGGFVNRSAGRAP